MSNINPKIIEKFGTFDLPESYMKLIEKILESEFVISRNASSSKAIGDSYNHILHEVVEDNDIVNYINEKKENNS